MWRKSFPASGISRSLNIERSIDIYLINGGTQSEKTLTSHSKDQAKSM